MNKTVLSMFLSAGCASAWWAFAMMTPLRIILFFPAMILSLVCVFVVVWESFAAMRQRNLPQQPRPYVGFFKG